MKLAHDVLLEIVDIVRSGLVSGTDISQDLRDLDLSVKTQDGEEKVFLSQNYVNKKNGKGI